MSSKKIKVAVIGVGEIGTRAHIPCYLKNENAELVGLVDANEKALKKASKKFKIRDCFASFDELLEKQTVDAISVCTPPTTHAPIVLKALSNDVNVLCEKPMATTTCDGKEMLQAAKKKNKVLMVGFNLRFQPNYRMAARQMKSGCLGHTHLVEFNLQSPNPLVSWSKSPWFFSEQSGGGVLMDKGPHVFDMLNFLFDDFPTAVSTTSSTFFDSSVEDSCVCLLDYPNHRIGIGIMSWLPSRVIDLLSVHGTAQSLFVSPQLYIEANANDLLEVALFRKATKMLVNLKISNIGPFKTSDVDTFQLEIDNFIEQIMTKRPDYSTALSGVNVLATSNATKESIKNGKKEKIDLCNIS